MDDKTFRSEQKMICSVCGAQMNHHAMKIDYSLEEEGILEEVHTCPRCGHCELRQAH
jgi:ribosomal protein S27AE